MLSEGRSSSLAGVEYISEIMGIFPFMNLYFILFCHSKCRFGSNNGRSVLLTHNFNVAVREKLQTFQTPFFIQFFVFKIIHCWLCFHASSPFHTQHNTELIRPNLCLKYVNIMRTYNTFRVGIFSRYFRYLAHIKHVTFYLYSINFVINALKKL